MQSNRLHSTSLRTLMLLFALALGSCASIVKGKTETVEFRSVPAGANVTITNSDGEVVRQGVTPCSADLKRGAGYFKKATYDVSFEKEGYVRQDVSIYGRANGWYIGGNLVFGGLIGWLILDPLTGGMWTMAKDPVEATLTAATPGT